MRKVEDFNLYGELNAFPDVVHCETIETRSLIHDWEFNPHRHLRLHQFLLLDAGGGSAVIEENHHMLVPGTLLNIPAGVVHGFQFEPGTSGWVVTLGAELLDESLIETEGLRPFLRRSEILRSTKYINEIIQSIFDQYPDRSFARAHVLRGLSGVLTGLVARRIAETVPHPNQTEHALLRRFEEVLDHRFQDHLGVSDYAALLGVTATHLSRVVREAEGVPASALIEARVIREARRYLAFSNLRVSEIAYQLGFGDPAYFSRVFRRATGVSPRDFRQRLNG